MGASWSLCPNEMYLHIGEYLTYRECVKLTCLSRNVAFVMGNQPILIKTEDHFPSTGDSLWLPISHFSNVDKLSMVVPKTGKQFMRVEICLDNIKRIRTYLVDAAHKTNLETILACDDTYFYTYLVERNTNSNNNTFSLFIVRLHQRNVHLQKRVCIENSLRETDFIHPPEQSVNDGNFILVKNNSILLLINVSICLLCFAGTPSSTSPLSQTYHPSLLTSYRLSSSSSLKCAVSDKVITRSGGNYLECYSITRADDDVVVVPKKKRKRSSVEEEKSKTRPSLTGKCIWEYKLVKSTSMVAKDRRKVQYWHNVDVAMTTKLVLIHLSDDEGDHHVFRLFSMQKSTSSPFDFSFILIQEFEKKVTVMDIKKLQPNGCWFYVESSMDEGSYLFLPFTFQGQLI